MALDHLFLTDTYFYLLWVPRTLFASEGKNKQIDTADIKVRLYENQQAIGPDQTAQWQQVLQTIKKRTHTIKNMLEDEQLAAAYEGLCEIEEEIKQQLTIPAVEKNRSRRCCLLIINTPPLKKDYPYLR